MYSASSDFEEIRSFPDPVAALTDIVVRVEEVSADAGVSADFDIILVPESFFTDEYLFLIGQPGY